jgi:hypothetical protein
MPSARSLSGLSVTVTGGGNGIGTARLGNALPRPLREAVLRGIGVGRIAGDTDQSRRRDYHERMFGRS